MKSAIKKDKNIKRVPKELIYEMRYGSPIYYRDYDKVLSGEKSLEEVMGSSKLQAIIVALIIGYLLVKINRNKYLIATNEAGFQWAPRTWRNLDIVKKVIWFTTFDKKVMVAEKGKRWFITDWNDTIEVIDDIKLNLDELLKEKGIKY